MAVIVLQPRAKADLSDIWQVIAEDSDDPATETRRRGAVAQPVEAFADDMDAVDAEPLDPFGSAADDEGVLFGEDAGLSGLTFEGLVDEAEAGLDEAPAFVDPDADELSEGVLTDTTGLGEEEGAALGFGLLGLGEDDAAAGGDFGEVDMDFNTSPPQTPLPPPAAAPEPARPAAFSFAPEPVRPSPAAQAIVLGTPGVDPFATGEGGAATALPADLFADDLAGGEELGGMSMPPDLNPFDESPTSAGVREVPAAPPPRVAAAEEPRKKKPARLKLHYRDRAAFIVEYRDNLRRGGSFIKTEKPLSIGRDVIFEIDAPGLGEPLVFEGIVTYLSDGRDGQPPGMGVDYRLDADARARLARAVGR